MNPTTHFLPILALAVATLLPRAATAEFQEGDFRYIVANNEVTITGYDGPGGDITIPAIIDNLPVSTIGIWAFGKHAHLTSVTIPSGVTYIGSAEPQRSQFMRHRPER